MSFPRYPAYKDSGFEVVPLIPESWEPMRLRFLLRDGYDGIKIGPFGSQLTSDMLDDAGDYKVYGQENVIANDFVRGSRYVDRAKFEELTAYEIKPGDLLVTMMGTSGRCDVVPTKMVPGIMDSHLLRIRVTPSIRPEFARLLIDDAAYVGTQIDLTGKGSIMHGLNSTIVKNLLLLVPPDSEQAQILTFLDHETARIDALVAEQERLIELLKEKRQAVISHAVTKGLDPSAPMKESGVEWLGEVPAHWVVSRLKNISPEITVGVVVEPSKYYIDDGVPALRSLNVGPMEIRQDGYVYFSPESNELLAKSKLQAGDLVAVRSGQPGTTAVIPEELEGCNCIDLIIIRKPLNDDARYMAWYLNSDAAVRQFTEGSGGAIQQHFNVGTAMNLLLTRPPIEEQTRIVSAIEAQVKELDQLIAEGALSIELLGERRTALISAAVTGQIDVRGWVSAEASA